MKKQTAAMLAVMAALILDSRWVSAAAAEALSLCIRTLIPGLFPLFVLSAMVVPGLRSFRLPFLSRLLWIPSGSEGLWLLGLLGGFPVGAACVSQSVTDGGLTKADARRMLGLCSFCGPSFLFGVLPPILGMEAALTIFLLQLESGLLLAAFWPGRSENSCMPSPETVTLPEAVRRAIGSMASVCAWVILAGAGAGFLRRWLFPLLPPVLGVLLTGLLELTNGIFAAEGYASNLRFLLCCVFVSFGGVSVLLQIGSFAARAGLSMSTCLGQKLLHALLAALLTAGYLYAGPLTLLVPPILLCAKIAVEISGTMVYNGPRKEGIQDAVS